MCWHRSHQIGCALMLTQSGPNAMIIGWKTIGYRPAKKNGSRWLMKLVLMAGNCSRCLSLEDAPAWLQEIPTIQTLRWVWEQQFQPLAEGGTFRTNETLVPAGQMHNSPY